MGRYRTGAETCEGSKRIELPWLLRKGYFRPGVISGTIKWLDNNGLETGYINVLTSKDNQGKYLRLLYTLKDVMGQRQAYDYKIYLTSISSNLKIGEVLYFICPQTKKRCRMLYMAYGSPIWKSREAYTHRLYYSCQIVPKMEYANERYWAIKRQLEKEQEGKQFTPFYDGKLTRTNIRRMKLQDQLDYWNRERWEPYNFPIADRADLASGGYDDIIYRD